MTVVFVSGSVVSPTVLVTLAACALVHAGLVVGVTDNSPVTRTAGSPEMGSMVVLRLSEESSTSSGTVFTKVDMKIKFERVLRRGKKSLI